MRCLCLTERFTDALCHGGAPCPAGKLLYLLGDHALHAQECLEHSVKLDPSNHLAWNMLGHCLWEAGRLPCALQSFASSNLHQPNKEALRQLSMVVRQIANADRHCTTQARLQVMMHEQEPNHGWGRAQTCVIHRAPESYFMFVTYNPYEAKRLAYGIVLMFEAHTHANKRHDPGPNSCELSTQDCSPDAAGMVAVATLCTMNAILMTPCFLPVPR